MTAVSPSHISLFAIEQTLAELIAMREGAENDDDQPAIEAIDKAIAEYMQREVRKVDSVAGAIRAYEEAAEFVNEEVIRLRARYQHFRETADRIKAHALKAMQQHGVTKLETPTNTLRVQKNGGQQAIEVRDTGLLPLSCQKVTVTMSAALWSLFSFKEKPSVKIIIEPDLVAIRARLACEPISGVSLVERGSHLRVE